MCSAQSISGLVVEYIVAIDVTRVRFPADAFMVHRSTLLPGPCFIQSMCTVAPMLHAKRYSQVTAVGFEPTPFRNGALSHRLRPLGQTVLSKDCKQGLWYFELPPLPTVKASPVSTTGMAQGRDTECQEAYP